MNNYNEYTNILEESKDYTKSVSEEKMSQLS